MKGLQNEIPLDPLYLILMMTGKPAGKQKYPCCLILYSEFCSPDV